MAMEMVCGNCRGRILVEQSSVVVACPHCGAHLQIGDDEPIPGSAVPTGSPLFTGPADSQGIGSSGSGTASDAPRPAVSFTSGTGDTFKPSPREVETDQERLPEILLTPPAGARGSVGSPPLTAPGQPTPIQATPIQSTPIPDNDAWLPNIDLEMPPGIAPGQAVTPPSTPVMPEPGTSFRPMLSSPPKSEQTDIWSRARAERAMNDSPSGSPPHDPQPDEENPLLSDFESTRPVDSSMIVPSGTASTSSVRMSDSFTKVPPTIKTSATADPREKSVPRYLFLLVLSYASAITLVTLYLLWRGSTVTLDLPDVVPAFNKNGKYTWKWIDEAPLPAPYRLRLGQSRRFGNLLVTPLKVTRGRLEFEHFSDPSLTKPPTDSPVLKLWIRFQNVSSNQTFPALDGKLLFERTADRQNTDQDKTNNFVCRHSERKRRGERIAVYDLPVSSEWNLKDQHLNTPIEPLQSWETYVPSMDSKRLSTLMGPLAWRLHFRKGYNPDSYRGVTTLLEVEFDSSEIQAEVPAV